MVKTRDWRTCRCYLLYSPCSVTLCLTLLDSESVIVGRAGLPIKESPMP